ncbi:MAG: thioredoxin family protein [Synechococcus sp. SB0673_bin_10]|nr:thioredoxin family protein [Synechococcus sp. SB0667_bin_8]MYG64081.1 thioredoxin family protein [Synechococcus sp. SB0675_bin_7]MYI71054.1 thioredoxin family protein [Synechococcus sp. SB0673_bin_10]MYK86688.1 thioredoxin family protein [Synechococcus sp. SB0669_bin_7]
MTQQHGRHRFRCHRLSLLALVVAVMGLLLPSSAWAGRLDNAYDGNIFSLYAGDGAMVPPRNSLADSLRRHRPAVLAFYLDDSSDCKRFAPTLSRLNGEFQAAADVIALSTDSLDPAEDAAPDNPSYYWRGLVPQVVILDRNGHVALDRTGQIPLEDLEQSLAGVSGLELPAAMAQRQTRAMEVNEINAEVVRAR